MKSSAGLRASFLAIIAAAGLAAAGEPVGTQAGDNAALVWDEAVLQGSRDTKPGPTIAARALAIAHTAMFDAWTAYDPLAVPTRPHRDWRRPAAEATEANRAK